MSVQLTHQVEEPETREGDAFPTLILWLPLQLLPLGQISLSFLEGKVILLRGEPTEVTEGSGIWVGGQGVYPGPRHGFLTLSDPCSNPERENVCTMEGPMGRSLCLVYNATSSVRCKADVDWALNAHSRK